MSFQRKLRKLILHPTAFFRDSKIFRNIVISPIKAEPRAEVNKNNTYSQKVENDILQILNFTKRYPVNYIRWKDGQILWPAFRFYFTLLAVSHANNKLKTARVYNPFTSHQWHKYHLENNFSTPVDTYTPEEGYDFLVVAAIRSISWVNENGKIHDRLLDPLIEKLNEYGKTKKIIIAKSGELPDNLAITPDYISFPMRYEVNNFHEINDFNTFISDAVNVFKKYKITYGDLRHFLDVFIYLYSNYIKLLKKIRPKAVFFFPIDYSIPLIMASHSLGIQAIDIQHGNMIGYYTTYNRWDEQYRTGYDLWPDTILTWSKREKRHVQQTFNGHISAFVFGYPWLEKSLVSNQPLRNEKLDNFRNKFRYIVIVSLSGHSYLPETIGSIVKDRRAKELGIGFILKRKQKDKKIIIPHLDNVYTDESITHASFLSSASYADLHMTEVSSCLYEADYIGLNTILTGDDWELHFKDLVEAERVYTAQSADDFYTVFEEAVSFCHYPRLVDNHSNEFNQFMRTLMHKN